MNCYRAKDYIINDLYPHWARADIDGGIFSDLWRLLEHEPPPYLTAEIAPQLDILYHGNASGRKPISPLVYSLIDPGRGRLLPAARARIAGAVMIQYRRKWERLWAVQTAEYNAKNNYDMTEESHRVETPNITFAGEIKAGRKSRTETETNAQSDIYGFNTPTADPVPEGKSTGGGSVTVTEPKEENVTNDNRTETGTRRHDDEIHRVGNIGVMTTQSLLTEEIGLWTWQFYISIFSDIDAVLALPIYYGAGAGCQTIFGYPPYITTESLPAGHISTYYTAQVEAEGDIPIRWEIVGALPPGLILTETPPVPPGTAPEITTATLPNGITGTAYNQALTATGTAPITWTISGILPTGVEFDMATHRLTGTPTAAGTYTFTAKAQNAYGADEQTYTVKITAPPPPTRYKWKRYNVNTSYQTTYSNDSGWRSAGVFSDSIVEDANRTSDVTFTTAHGFDIHGTEYATTSDGLGVTCCKGTPSAVEKYEPRGEGQGWDLYTRSCDEHTTETHTKGSYIDDVTADNRNAYPDDGIDGGYWYVYAGTV